MKEPTLDGFLSFLLHTGYLSLTPSRTTDMNYYSTFVVPNKEIRNLIDEKLMAPFYEMIFG